MGLDDDEDCAHVWVLEQVAVSGRGADQVSVCQVCGVPAYVPGQAALRDTRPPLDGPI